jgi:hypothetical protein
MSLPSLIVAKKRESDRKKIRIEWKKDISTSAQANSKVGATE